MRIVVASRKVVLSRALRISIHRQVAKMAQRFASAIVSANVELSDRNGRRGGGDKRCRVRLVLARGNDILGEDVRANLPLAVSRAINLAANSLHRHLRLAPA